MTLKRTLTQLLILTAAFSFALSINYLYAAVWSGPPVGVVPPANNVNAPIHVGTDPQIKDGILEVGHSLNTSANYGLVTKGRIRIDVGGIQFSDGSYQDKAAGASGLSFNKYMHVQDQKPSGTHGGSYTSGAYRTRVLNTSVINNIAGASLNTTSNTITLPAGSYFIEASAPAMIGLMKAKLQNISGGTTALLGTAEFADGSSNDGSSRSYISGVITINSPQDFQVMMRGTQNVANFGFGSATNFSDIEIYTDVKIWKLD